MFPRAAVPPAACCAMMGHSLFTPLPCVPSRRSWKGSKRKRMCLEYSTRRPLAVGCVEAFEKCALLFPYRHPTAPCHPTPCTCFVFDKPSSPIHPGLCLCASNGQIILSPGWIECPLLPRVSVLSPMRRQRVVMGLRFAPSQVTFTTEH